MAASTSSETAMADALRARQRDLHEQLMRAWEENVRLMDEAEERKGIEAGARVHLMLSLQHSGYAARKLGGSTLSRVGDGVEFVARCHPASSSAYDLVAATLGGAVHWLLRLGERSGNELEAAMLPVLRRRANREAGGKKMTDAERDAKQTAARYYCAEDKWQQCEAGVYFPAHPYKQKWDMGVMLLIIYSCLDVPYRIGMNAEAEGVMWFFEVCVTLVFLSDLFINFNTAYIEGPNYVIHRGMIATNYLKSWFIIDSLSSVPVELIDLITPYLAGPDGASANSSSMRALRALRMVRLLRMLRLLKINQYIDALEARAAPARS
jgi:hypothetical protein